MRKLLVIPKALAVTLFACGSPHPAHDAGTDGGTDGGALEGGLDGGGSDAGDDGGADAGCDCKNACPPIDCFPFQDQDGGLSCQCAI